MLEEKTGLEGKVKWFSKAKGYGFIRPDGGTEDVFVHISDLHDSGYKDLQKNDEVEFDLKNTFLSRGSE